MADTSARMLRLLSLLQVHRFWSGAELSERLEVSDRTLRRDVDRLRQLGYHIESVRGADGGYQMAAGATLPPMVFEHDEAVALAVGLREVAHGTDDATAEASVRALAKLVAMLPPSLRRQVELMADVADATPFAPTTVTPPAEVLGVVAQACRDQVRLRFGYRRADGEQGDRYVEPYRLVTRGRRWYLVAYDLDRDDWRTFRVDRTTDPSPARNTFDPRPLPADDLAAYVAERIAALRPRHEVEVVVHTTEAHAEAVLGRWVTVAPLDDTRCAITMSTDTLDWPLLAIVKLGVPFEVVAPPELAAAVRDAGALLGSGSPRRRALRSRP